PPPPPRPAARSVDPLLALSKPILPPAPVRQEPAVTVAKPAPIEPEELADLSDEDMELWNVGGTRIMPKPTSTPSAPPAAVAATVTEPAAIAATMKSTDVPPLLPAPLAVAPTQYQPLSYPPVAMAPSVPAPAVKKKSNAMTWVLVAGLTGLFGLSVVGAGVGYFVYRAHQATELASEVAAEETNTTTTTTTTTASPADTTTTTASPAATTHAAPEPQATTQPQQLHAAAVATTAPPPVAHKVDEAHTRTTTSATTGSGTLRTFAAGSGKAVFVDGHLAGIGPGPLKTTCGRHSIVVGEGKARSFNVPCDGSTITVGSPDGA
ncbi:MAG TPA: hypothetical protein VLM85_06020, partial [Polyangiaceae bacterium]|nr:hypothetical protein [Polyangiaceae bacterium]